MVLSRFRYLGLPVFWIAYSAAWGSLAWSILSPRVASGLLSSPVPPVPLTDFQVLCACVLAAAGALRLVSARLRRASPGAILAVALVAISSPLYAPRVGPPGRLVLEASLSLGGPSAPVVGEAWVGGGGGSLAISYLARPRDEVRWCAGVGAVCTWVRLAFFPTGGRFALWSTDLPPAGRLRVSAWVSNEGRGRRHRAWAEASCAGGGCLVRAAYAEEAESWRFEISLAMTVLLVRDALGLAVARLSSRGAPAGRGRGEGLYAQTARPRPKGDGHASRMESPARAPTRNPGTAVPRCSDA